MEEEAIEVEDGEQAAAIVDGEGRAAAIVVDPTQHAIGVCSICYESMYDDDIESHYLTAKPLPCGHQMHLQCLSTWIQGKDRKTCPLCRVELNGGRALRLCTEPDDDEDPIARRNHAVWLRAGVEAGRVRTAVRLEREEAHRVAVERGSIIPSTTQEHPSDESEDDSDFEDTLAQARAAALQRRNAASIAASIAPSIPNPDISSSEDDHETVPNAREESNMESISGFVEAEAQPVRRQAEAEPVRRQARQERDGRGRAGEFEFFVENQRSTSRGNRALPLGSVPNSAAPIGETRTSRNVAETRTRTPVRSPGGNRRGNRRDSTQIGTERDERNHERRNHERRTQLETSPSQVLGGTALHRQRCIEIRRSGQSSQAAAMIATNQSAIRPVYKGDMATVFPQDSRDQGGHSRNGVEGIVFNNPKQPGYAIAVVTKYGIIGNNGKPSLIPNQRYKPAHGTQPLDARMGQLKRQVLGGTFNRARTPIKSMRHVHRLSSNQEATGRPERRKCGCKHNEQGTCSSNQCGCRKSGQICNPRCGCRGNCNNT